MNGGYIYGDPNMFSAILDGVSKSQSTITYKNAFYEAKRLSDSGKPVYFKHGGIISSVLTVDVDETSIAMQIVLENIKSLIFSQSSPNTISIT